MNITYYESTTEDGQALQPPWVEWMKTVDGLLNEERRSGRDTFEVHWREDRDRAGPGDAVLVGSRDRKYSPASTEIATGRTSRAPRHEGREYTERTIVGQVAPQVFGVVRVGNEAARESSITSFLNHRTGYTEQTEQFMRFRRILSPQFLERLEREGSVVGRLDFTSSLAGARQIYGRSMLASGQRLRQRDPDGVTVRVVMELNTRKRKVDNLSDSEKLDGLALLEEARNLVDHAGELDGGRIDLITEGGGKREPVHLSQAYLSATAKMDTHDRWIDPLDALTVIHEKFAPLRSQVERMLRS
jgi:hypothetical protein